MELAMAGAALCSALKAREDAQAVNAELRLEVDVVARAGNWRRQLRGSGNASRQWEKAAARLREGNLPWQLQDDS
jgi:hypothetical protein